jgi:hypothetical protein
MMVSDPDGGSYMICFGGGTPGPAPDPVPPPDEEQLIDFEFFDGESVASIDKPLKCELEKDSLALTRPCITCSTDANGKETCTRTVGTCTKPKSSDKDKLA